MPASNATFAKLAIALERIDPADGEAIEAFFTDVFPTYSGQTRAIIGDWLASLTEDATGEDLDRLFGALGDRDVALARRASAVAHRPAADGVPHA